MLTGLGRSLRPVIVALAAWGNSHLAPDQHSVVLVDAHSGEQVEPVVVDARTDRRLDDSDAYVFTAGPAAGDAMRNRYAERPAVPHGRGVRHAKSHLSQVRGRCRGPVCMGVRHSHGAGAEWRVRGPGRQPRRIR